MNKNTISFKRLLGALLALCMLCMTLPAIVLAQEATADEAADGEAATAAVTLTMLGYDGDSSGRTWENNAFFTRMAELTGVAFTFEEYTSEEDYAARIAKLSAKNQEKLPDVLFKAALSDADQRRMAADGTLVDLKPLIAQYAPNLAALLEENPEWEKAITLPDGKIVALPLFNTMERQCGVWLNESWVRALGYTMPTDADSLYEVLTAIKTGDPNGNGKADEIPLNVTGVWEMRWLLGLFGINANDYNLAMQDGSVVFAPRMEGYRAFVEYLKKLYDEGLLPAGAFKDVHALNALNDKESDTVVSGAIVTVTPYSQMDATAALSYTLMVPANGVWRDLLGEVWSGAFAVTAGCEDVESALKWVDALYDENNVLAYAGVEGVDYEVTRNGWTWILDTYRTVDTIRAESIIYTAGTIPGIMPSDFMRNVDSELDRHVIANSDALKQVATQPLPVRILTDEEAARVSELQSALGEAVDVGIARFVTGEVPLDDESWQAYQEQLTSLGADELTAIFTDVIAR